MRRFPSSDGVEVAAYDLGGQPQAPPLLLVHATGFCAQAFAPLVEHLGSSFRCWAVDLRGHGVTSTPPGLDYAWSSFAEDVLAAVDGLDLAPPLSAVGHSSGGASLLLAEAERPGTFSALWCYEPIVWPDPDLGRDRARMLADRTRRRRSWFPSRHEAYANFSSKPPLTVLAPDALARYVDCGFVDAEDGGVELRCRPEVEAAIYLQAVAEDRFKRLADVACPVVVAAGGATDAITPATAAELADALPDGRLRVFEGLGHFGPLQDPAAVGAAIVEDLAGG